MAAAKPLLEEEGEEEDQKRGSSTANGLAPPEVPEPEEGRHVGPRFWHGGQDEEGWEVPASRKAWGNAPAVEPPPLETDEELAWWLQDEEVAVEQMQWGQDAATLAVVREAAGPLMQGQVEGLGRPS